MQIPFTQFLLPDGRQRKTSFECPIGLENKVTQLLDAGSSFEVEMLQAGLISLTVEFEKPNGEIETLSHEISSNDLQIDNAVVKLINNAFNSFKEIESSELGIGF